MQPNRSYDNLCDQFARLLKIADRDTDYRVLRSIDLMMRSRDEFVAGERIIVVAEQGVVGVEVPVLVPLIQREMNIAVDLVVSYVKHGIARVRADTHG